MSYVNKYDVGQIKLDLPYANFIHELPLLSFGDVQHTINLSLIFNYANRTDNSFNIAPGFKLNLQKRTVGNQSQFQEANGKCVDLIYNNGIYTFNDDSQRIMRTTISGYEVEYPDFSKETYNGFGHITSTIDKYGDTILSFTYSGFHLTRISYRNSKHIDLKYNTSNQLVWIAYAGRITYFSYASNEISIDHYSDEEYIINTANGISVGAIDTGNSEVNSLRLTKSNSDKTITVTDHYNKSVVYYFHDTMDTATANATVDITNNNTVKTRMQFEGDKALYSYEIADDATFRDNRFAGNVYFYNTANISSNNKALGVQTMKDGISMTYNGILREWNTSVTKNANKPGYYVLSGWVKSNSNSISGTTLIIGRSQSDHVGSIYVDLSQKDQWRYFSCMFYMPANEILVFSVDDSLITTKDFRITFQETDILTDGDISHTNMSECILLYEDEELPFKDAEFRYSINESNVEILNAVTFSDIMRYKMRKKRTGACNEVYYNDCKGVITGVQNLKVLLGESYVSVSNFDLGIRAYSNKKESLTKISIDEHNQNTDIVKTHSVDGIVVSTELLNKYFDITTSIVGSVTTNYDRNSFGMIVSKTITADGEDEAITTSAEYDDNCTKLLRTTDEFGYVTEYTTNTTWGVVTSVQLPDGSAITDDYDDDMCTPESRTFGTAGSNTNKLTYSEGRVATLASGNLEYLMSYANGRLSTVQKLIPNTDPEEYNGIEAHDYVEANGMSTVTSTYPSSTNPLYTTVQKFDKYGKLVTIDDDAIANNSNILTNVYDIQPTFNSSNGALLPNADNSSSLLAMSTDLLRGETSRYMYSNKGELIEKSITDSANFSNKVSTETFTYDSIGRLIADNYIYNPAADSSVRSEITYVDGATDPKADGRIQKYVYKVNGIEKAKTENSYDVFKRISSKTYTVGNTEFTRGIEYNATRVDEVTDSVGGTFTYEYDSIGRIVREKDASGNILKSYTYDEYGQLIREDNKSLDKTLKYEYNEDTGNLEFVKTYGYTTGALSGNPIKTETFSYGNSTHPDRLTAFDGKPISYNSMGCVTNYDGKNYTWRRGKLGGFSRGSSTQAGTLYESFTANYDALGRRLSKNYVYDPNPASTSDYSYSYNTQYNYDQSGRLVREVITERYVSGSVMTRELVYLYDESSMIGCVYSVNNTVKGTYYYQRNLLGDVVAIYDIAGTKITEYTYDAYGNCTFTYGYGNEFSRINPIRYRGYYLDRETNLYYLNSRYYNPEWRRFLSPDDSVYLDPENVNGLNLYCYCNNDPINFTDPSGNFAITSFLIGLGIAAAIGAGIGAASYTVGQIIDCAITKNFEWSWGGFVGSIVGGALGGIAAYSFNLLQLGMVGVLVSGFSTTAVTMVGENITNDASYSSNDIFALSFVDGLFSIISSGVMKNIKFVPINSGRGSYSAISKQMYTKITNGTITRVSAKTFGKMFISEFYDGLFGLLLN